MGCGVPAGDVVIELSLNVPEERRGSDPEEGVVEPGVAQLLFDQGQPSARVLGGANATSRLEPNDIPGAFVVVTDGPVATKDEKKSIFFKKGN